MCSLISPFNNMCRQQQCSLYSPRVYNLRVTAFYWQGQRETGVMLFTILGLAIPLSDRENKNYKRLNVQILFFTTWARPEILILKES